MTDRLRRISPVTALLIAAMAVSAGVLIWLQSHLTFFLDEWDLLLHRRGFSVDAFLRPHNEHIAAMPAAVYKALQATLGMDSPQPYQVLSVATFASSAALLFVWVRRRAGELVALLAAVAVLFGGAAYEDLLSAFQIGYFGSVAFGLAAMLWLERPSARNDVLACVALILACSFSSLGLPFTVGAAIIIATDLEPRRRAWIAAVPVILFAAWWLGWGRHADTAVSFDSIAGAPAYVLAGLANGISALLGLAPSSGAIESNGLDWGRPLLFALVGLAAWRLTVQRGGSRWLWAVVAMLLTFWILAAINAGLFREPTAPRYTYIGAVFTLMIVAELLRGVRVPNWSLAIAFVVVAVAIAANSINLRDGYRSFESLSSNERGGLTGLEFARDTVSPEFLLTPENSDAPYFDYVDARSYLSAIDAFGSPGFTEDELLAADEHVRAAADKAVAAAEEIALTPGVAAGESCAELELDAAGAAETMLGPGAVELVAGSGANLDVTARRFASATYSVDLGRVRGGRSARLELPADRAATPWTLRVVGAGPIRVCEG